jgi:integrase
MLLPKARRLPAYVTRNRHGTYYFRAVIPKALRSTGLTQKLPREFRRSLQTDSWRVATIRARRWRVEFDALIGKIQAGMTAKKRNNSVTREDAAEDSDGLTLHYTAMLWEYPDGTKVHFKSDWSNPADKAAFDKVIETFATTTVPPSEVANPVQRQSSVTFNSVVDDYLRHATGKRALRASTIDEYRHTTKLFVALEGDLPLATISNQTISNFRDKLLRYPSNARKRREYRDLSPPELVALDIPEKDRLARRTVQKHLERLSSVFHWAVKQRLISSNPAEGEAPTPTKSGYRPFEREELSQLFAPDTWQPRFSYAYWLPLLGLYTGARIGELCQLKVADIISSEGVPVISIRPDADFSWKPKTAAGERLIPIHSQLVKLGFLEFVEARRKNGDARLFPELKKSDTASKWFTRHRKNCGIGGTDRKKVFHSFRKNVATALARAKVPKDLIQEIIGHEPEDVTKKAYIDTSPPELLREQIEQLDFGLDLGHLKDGWHRFVSPAQE